MSLHDMTSDQCTDMGTKTHRVSAIILLQHFVLPSFFHAEKLVALHFQLRPRRQQTLLLITVKGHLTNKPLRLIELGLPVR